MPNSQNGWPASPDPAEIDVQPCRVAGVTIGDGLKAGPVAAVLGYVLLQLHRRVEPLVEGQCWGYKYRPVVGGTELSNHASATAVDVNAPVHPLGQRGTFSSEQVDEIHRILAEVDGVVRWGGDYSGRVDEMHFEINADEAAVAAVAARLEQAMTLFVPDISHHQEDISIQGLINDGAAALIARVGQGAGRRTNGQTYATTRDRKWQRNLAEAKRLGLAIVPYWYIGNLISADENARLAAEWVGDTSPPWMLDHEDASGSIAFYREVLAAFQRRGLRVILSYIPQWYWSGAGQRASLAGLPPLVSSRYTSANGSPGVIYPGDDGAGWAGYGGNNVALWQFTNQALMAGQKVDCSAFRGTRAQLAAFLGGRQEDDVSAQEVWSQTITSAGGYPASAADWLWTTRAATERIEAQLAAINGSLDKHEADILAALRMLQQDAIDEDKLAAALGPIVAPLIHAGATPDQVEAAVRKVFASASQSEGGNQA